MAPSIDSLKAGVQWTSALSLADSGSAKGTDFDQHLQRASQAPAPRTENETAVPNRPAESQKPCDDTRAERRQPGEDNEQTSAEGSSERKTQASDSSSSAASEAAVDEQTAGGDTVDEVQLTPAAQEIAEAELEREESDDADGELAAGVVVPVVQLDATTPELPAPDADSSAETSTQAIDGKGPKAFPTGELPGRQATEAQPADITTSLSTPDVEAEEVAAANQPAEVTTDTSQVEVSQGKTDVLAPSDTAEAEPQSAEVAVEVATDVAAEEQGGADDERSDRRDKKPAVSEMHEAQKPGQGETIAADTAVPTSPTESNSAPADADVSVPSSAAETLNKVDGQTSAAPHSNTPARLGEDATRKTTATTVQQAQAVSDVDRARFVQRVSRAFAAAEEQGTPVKLRLSPPELGSMRLEISLKDGAMTARLETETSAARNLLLEHLPVLRDRLAEQNIRIDRFDVDVSGGQSGGTPDRTDDSGDGNRRTPQSEHHWQRRGAATAAATTSAATPHSISSNAQLNVLI